MGIVNNTITKVETAIWYDKEVVIRNRVLTSKILIEIRAICAFMAAVEHEVANDEMKHHVFIQYL